MPAVTSTSGNMSPTIADSASNSIDAAFGFDRPGIQEALVDRIDLDVRSEPLIDRVRAAAHIAVESVVRGEDDSVLALHQVADHEHQRAHSDAERLGLAGACDRAAIVVGQHDDRPAIELGIEYALAGAVEAVSVVEGEAIAGSAERYL